MSWWARNPAPDAVLRGIASFVGVKFGGAEQPASVPSNAAQPATISKSDQAVIAHVSNANVVPFDRLPVAIQQRVMERKQKKHVHQ